MAALYGVAVWVCVAVAVAAVPDTLRFGAVQYAPWGAVDMDPSAVIAANTAAYLSVVQAESDAVDVLVFPEGTLGWIFATNRTDVIPFCATLPAPGPDVVVCPAATTTRAAPITTTWGAVQSLSCAAVATGVTLLINLCDDQACIGAPDDAPKHTACFGWGGGVLSTELRVARGGGDFFSWRCCGDTGPSCRPDGRLLRNVDVVLAPNGTLLQRYYKSHLFSEAAMFDPVTVADRQLDTAWISAPSLPPSVATRLGLLTCFDMEFAYPWLPLYSLKGVRHFLMASWWVNTLPLFHAAAFQQAFSRVTQSTLVAANSGVLRAAGGGIWVSGRPLAWHYDPDQDTKQLVLVASVPLAPSASTPSFVSAASLATTSASTPAARIASHGATVVSSSSLLDSSFRRADGPSAHPDVVDGVGSDAILFDTTVAVPSMDGSGSSSPCQVWLWAGACATMWNVSVGRPLPPPVRSSRCGPAPQSQTTTPHYNSK
jgi:predicted amidohydrolase